MSFLRRGVNAGKRLLKSVVQGAVVRATDGRVADRHPLEQRLTRAERLRQWARYGETVHRRDDHDLQQRHVSYWESKEHADWYERTADRFEVWFLREHQPFIGAVVELLAGDRGMSHVVEVGTGNGQVLEYFSERAAAVESFVGVDLNQLQIERNRARYADSRMTFVCADASQYFREHLEPGTLCVTNAGVFEYFTQPALEALVAQVAVKAPCGFALIEPLDPLMDLREHIASYPYGAERSFSHNYPAMLRGHGFKVVHERECRVGKYRFLELVAHRSGAEACLPT